MLVAKFFHRHLNCLTAMALSLGVLILAWPSWSGDVPARPGGAQMEIVVASNGWHSAIFLDRAKVPPGAIPEAADFPGARYLGFGWGDAEFFPARDPGILMALNAALQPTPSVLHVTGLWLPPRQAYPKDEVIALGISARGFEKLVRYLSATFARENDKRAKVFAPGLNRYSKFYRANGEFHLLNTCNSWTARGLAVAGVAMDDTSVIRAEDLMAQLRELGVEKPGSAN